MALSCLHFCTSDAWGGLELYSCTVMKELKAAGCSVIAVCRPHSKIEQVLKDAGIVTCNLPADRTFSLRSLRAVEDILRERSVDVLHVHFHRDIWPASLALRRDVNRRLFLSIYMGVPRKNDLLHRYIYRRVDGVFTSSRELNRRLPDLYPVASEKIHYLPYGRDVRTYARDDEKRVRIRAQFGVNADEMLVGTMVRIDPGKSVLDFARSYLYIDETARRRVKYLIVGEPTRKGYVRDHESPFEPHCEAYLQELRNFIDTEGIRDRILLAGFQSDLIGYLSAMDVFVFPSRDELYSLAVLDAMGMGLPVVAARAGGTVDQVEEGRSGEFYGVGNSAEAAEKISLYLSHPDLRAQQGANGREFVLQNHDMKTTINQLLGFYQRPRAR
ncbi:MAG TPA: glycosyltransferase family 4 protein [Bacteroidota bacterium]|nr:glycosyltransferase family 4 protein [Bacteroidota bacterium]